MESFICVHGHITSSCTMCMAIAEAVADYMLRPEEEEYDWIDDYYLDRDERMLSESEEE